MTIEEVLEKVNGDLKGAYDESVELKEKLQAEQLAVAAAEEVMQAATDAADPDAYQRAAGDRAAHQSICDMYEKRIKHLEEEALIDEEEYHSLLSETYSDNRRRTWQDEARLLELSQEMAEISNQYNDRINQVNNLLYKLQFNLFRERGKIITPEQRTPDGRLAKRAVTTHPREERIVDYGPYNWGMSALRSNPCQDYIKRQKQQQHENEEEAN